MDLDIYALSQFTNSKGVKTDYKSYAFTNGTVSAAFDGSSPSSVCHPAPLIMKTGVADIKNDQTFYVENVGEDIENDYEVNIRATATKESSLVSVYPSLLTINPQSSVQHFDVTYDCKALTQKGQAYFD